VSFCHSECSEESVVIKFLLNKHEDVGFRPILHFVQDDEVALLREIGKEVIPMPKIGKEVIPMPMPVGGFIHSFCG
jgi:hypothetical protein